MNRISNKDTVYFLAPKIDFLSLVFPIHAPEDQDGVVGMLVNLVKDDSVPEFKDAKKPFTPGYGLNIGLINPTSGGRILIQARPKSLKANFMRFELNPEKLGTEGLAFFKERLSYFFGNEWTYADIATKGKVTRVDLACDVINCSISDLIVQSTKPGKSHVYYGCDEEAETVYLDIKKNSHQYAYNKRQTQRDKEREPKYGGIPWTRFERRIMANRPITKLCDIKKNPLEVFQVFYPDLASPPEKPYHWAFFADSCRQRGIEAAIDHLPKGLREAYRKALDVAEDGFWRPDKIWSFWPKALKASGLLELGE